MSQSSYRSILLFTLLSLLAGPPAIAQSPEIAPVVDRDSEVEPGERAINGTGTSDAVIHLEQSLATFQNTITTETGNGNQLVDIEVLTSAGPITNFSGVFYPVAGTVYTLIHEDELVWDAFLASMNLLDGRWLDIEVGFHGGASRKYSAIFLEDGNDHNYLIDTDMSETTLQATLEAQLRAGFALVDFEAHTNPTSGETRFDAIWTKDERQPMTHLYYDLESADVTDLLNPLAGRVIDLERYHSSFFGEERFAIVLANYPGGNWSFDRYMDQPDLLSLNGSYSDSDTHLIDLDVFLDSSSNVRFSGVWGDNWKSLNEVAEIPTDGNPVALTTGLNNLINAFEVTKPNGVEGIVGFHARNLRTNQTVSYRADEPFYVASAAKLAPHIRFWMQVEAGHFAPLNEGTMLAYSNNSQTGAPWYVDDRDNPGFSSGSPGQENNLGDSFTLDRFDEGMMSESDNAATSALIDDAGIGLAHDTTNLNEWLSGIDGVGKGWGIVTSIHDVDRLIFWNGQHTDDKKTDPSYFLAPGHTFGPRRRGNAYNACVVGGAEPATCVPDTTCDRCNDVSDCDTGETCQRIEDPWGDLRIFFGLSSTEDIPDFDRIGYARAFAAGPNSATPRAYANLLEKFWDGEFLTTKQTNALDNMNEGTRLDDNLCRADFDNDGCKNGEGYNIWTKGGSKGSSSMSSVACTSTAILQMTDPQSSLAEDEVFVLTWFTRDNGRSCSNPTNPPSIGIGNLYTAAFATEILQAVAVDLAFDNGSFTPTTLIEDGELRVDVSLDNLGGAFTNTQFTVELWASTNLILDTTSGLDIQIASLNLNGISSFGGAGVGNYPVQTSLAPLPPDTYNIFYIIDPATGPEPSGQIPELDESDASNRGLLTTQQLTILPPCPDVDADGYADCDPGCLPGALLCDDCDDAVDTTYPGAIEQCNGVDDDCDLVIDNDIPTPTYARRVQHEDPQAADRFGSDVANVGDVDGDGFDDLAIGMRGENLASGVNLGLVRVVSSADFSTICEATLPTPTSQDNLGWSVAAANGDLNGNATDDFVVGIPYYNNPPFSNSGAVAAFNLPDCAFIRLMVDPLLDSSDQLGVSIASLGDVNNDSVPDIAAGSTRASLS
ncbi:MAG: serine hydrolase, partial [Acidobacteriota bacterium]|nr:serine hydrolase [Acidobacteriota bacterium]